MKNQKWLHLINATHVIPTDCGDRMPVSYWYGIKGLNGVYITLKQAAEFTPNIRQLTADHTSYMIPVDDTVELHLNVFCNFKNYQL